MKKPKTDFYLVHPERHSGLTEESSRIILSNEEKPIT